MPLTPFPATPSDVVALTVLEFTCDLDLNGSLTLESACQRFHDANRALVWLIRFHALAAWCERADVTLWLQSHPSHAQHACELAASFALNNEWQFDATRFRSAVEAA